MKKLAGILLLALALSAPASAQNKMKVDASLDGLSAYNWRGARVGGVQNKISLQPSLTFGFGDSPVSFNIWGATYLQDRSAVKSVDELDFTLSFSKTIDPTNGVGLSAGYIQYTFPNAASGAKHSEEAYAGLSLDKPGSPAVTFYYDFNLLKAWYLAFSGGYSVPLSKEDGAPSLNLGVSAALSDYGNKTGFNDITATAGLGFTVGKASITPKVAFSYADNKLGNPKKSAFWGGVNISTSM